VESANALLVEGHAPLMPELFLLIMLLLTLLENFMKKKELALFVKSILEKFADFFVILAVLASVMNASFHMEDIILFTLNKVLIMWFPETWKMKN
jgi:hypothetical protein